MSIFFGCPVTKFVTMSIDKIFKKSIICSLNSKHLVPNLILSTAVEFFLTQLTLRSTLSQGIRVHFASREAKPFEMEQGQAE